MKLIYFFAALLLITCNDKHGINSGVISFAHTGIVNHITNPLYVSTEPIVIHLDKKQMADLKEAVGDTMSVTPQKENEYITAKFDRVVTDKKTLYYLSTFIINNDQFYTTSAHQNNDPSEDSYNVNINGKGYSIYYKLKNDFFIQLRTYLLKKNADHKLIEAISHLN